MIPVNATMVADMQNDMLTGGVLVRRVFACVLDGIVLGGVTFALWTMLASFTVLTLGLGMPLWGVLPAIPVLYVWLTVASPMSATPGQAMLGLSVRSNTDLTRPTPLQALIYAAGYYFTVAAGAIWLAVALITVRRRCFHDMLAGVVIVRERALTVSASYWNMGQQTHKIGGWPAA